MRGIHPNPFGKLRSSSIKGEEVLHHSIPSSACVLLDKLPNALDGLLSLGEDGRKSMPDVDHVIPDLKDHINASLLGALGNAG